MTLNGLVTYLPFENENEVQSTVGNVTYSGVNGGSAFFNNPPDNNATDYFTVTNTINIPLTLAFWFNVNELGNGRTLISSNNYTGGIYVGLTDEFTIRIKVAMPELWIDANMVFPVTPNTWNHICITIDSSYDIMCYLNGEFSGAGEGSANLVNFDLIYIGGDTSYQTGGYLGFLGYIENFMLYNRALSYGEVTSLYNLETITSGRVIYLHLDSGNFDNSGGNNNNNNNQSNKYWLAGGYNSDASNCIAKSSDGLTWSYSTNNPFTGGLCSYVKWNESYWLSLGANSNNTVCIAKSNDGLVWDESTNNPFNYLTN
jgi:hypothetical protein